MINFCLINKHANIDIICVKWYFCEKEVKERHKIQIYYAILVLNKIYLVSQFAMEELLYNFFVVCLPIVEKFKCYTTIINCIDVR